MAFYNWTFKISVKATGNWYAADIKLYNIFSLFQPSIPTCPFSTTKWYVTQRLKKGYNYERAKHLVNLLHIKDSMRLDIYISFQLVPSFFPFFVFFLIFQILFCVCVCLWHRCLRIILCSVINRQKENARCTDSMFAFGVGDCVKLRGQISADFGKTEKWSNYTWSHPTEFY